MARHFPCTRCKRTLMEFAMDEASFDFNHSKEKEIEAAYFDAVKHQEGFSMSFSHLIPIETQT